MKIVADINISFVEEAFSTLGTVQAVRSWEITPELVRDADLLLTRSTVKLNRDLLEGSRVRFVATATSGTDHVDKPYLHQKKIAFADAHGSNARSVAEWFAAALLELSVAERRPLQGLCVGVVGVGKVGTEVVQMARAMGMKVLLCDPPRARKEQGEFVDLHTVLQKAQVVTFHTPLHKTGPDKTLHMIGAEEIATLAHQTLLFNASRGPVIHADPLVRAVQQGKILAALDVWEHEPGVSPRDVDAMHFSTPHIAGHSLDGKAYGTEMIYVAAARHLGVPPTWNKVDALPAQAPPTTIQNATGTREEHLLQAVRASYVIQNDDKVLRNLVKAHESPEEVGKAFRHYRNHYPVKREFPATTLILDREDPSLQTALENMGFFVQNTRST